MRITPTGVAIGNANPLVALDVTDSNIGVNRILRVWNQDATNANSGSELRLSTSGSSPTNRITFTDNADFRASIDCSLSDDLIFKTGSALTTRLTISSAGLFTYGEQNNFVLALPQERK